MRPPIALVLLASFCLQLPAAGQTVTPIPKETIAWAGVETLPLHLSVHVTGDTQSATCLIDSVSDSELHCSRTSESGIKQYVFTRHEIQKIKTTHRLRSTMWGLGLGAAFGMGYGAAIKKTENGYSDIQQDSMGSLMAAGALVFAPIGAGIGALLNLSSHTVYRR
jgi:hypothetical protein